MAPVSILDHKAWLNKASEDIKIVKILLQHEDLLAGAAYHAQQAAEKALKAFLIHHTRSIKKTHDLTILIEECVKADCSFIQLLTFTDMLNGYCTYARYPDDWFKIDTEEAHQANTAALAIIKFVKQRLPKE